MYFKEMILRVRNRIRVMIGEGLPEQSFMGEEGKMHKNDIEEQDGATWKIDKGSVQRSTKVFFFFFFPYYETQLMSTSPACSENWLQMVCSVPRVVVQAADATIINH